MGVGGSTIAGGPNFRTEHRTAPNAHQRARGRAEVRFGTGGLEHLYQSGCAKILLPKTYGPIPEAVFINTSGGVTGGDVLACAAQVVDGAALTMTTQAAERVYRAIGSTAQVCNTISVGKNSTLEWVPQETILFNGSALERRLDVSLDETARFLGLEMLVLGRKAMNEDLSVATLRDHWRVSRGGRLIFADSLRFCLPENDLTTAATFDGARALATVVYVAPDAEDRLVDVRAVLSFDGVKAAASAWDGKMVIRFMAQDAQPLKAALISFLIGFRQRDLPRVWHM